MMSRKFVTSCAVREFLSLHSLVTLLPKLHRKHLKHYGFLRTSRELSFPVAVKTGRIVLSSKTDALNSSTLVQLLTPHYSLLTMNQRQLIFTPDLLL